MVDEKPIVEALDYIGGQDEHLGGYCEPLVIRIDGKEYYILHTMSTYNDVSDNYKIKSRHHKVEFKSLEELLREFGRVKERLGIDAELPWIETNSKCGYDISEQHFQEAHKRRSACRDYR